MYRLGEYVFRTASVCFSEKKNMWIDSCEASFTLFNASNPVWNQQRK